MEVGILLYFSVLSIVVSLFCNQQSFLCPICRYV